MVVQFSRELFRVSNCVKKRLRRISCGLFPKINKWPSGKVYGAGKRTMKVQFLMELFLRRVYYSLYSVKKVKLNKLGTACNNKQVIKWQRLRTVKVAVGSSVPTGVISCVEAVT